MTNNKLTPAQRAERALSAYFRPQRVEVGRSIATNGSEIVTYRLPDLSYVTEIHPPHSGPIGEAERR